MEKGPVHVKDILQEIGLTSKKPQDPDLSPEIKCEECQDSEWVHVPGTESVTRCECSYLKATDHLVEQMPDLFRDFLRGHWLAPDAIYRKFPKQTPRAGRIEAHKYPEGHGWSMACQTEMLRHVMSNPLDGYSIFGPTGTGKTLLLWALAKESCYAGRRVIFRKAFDLALEMRDEEFSRPGSLREFPSIEDLLDSPGGKVHLFIDEMEKIAVTDFILRKFFQLFDAAYSMPKRLSISICSNLSLQEFIQVFGEAIRRRIGVISDSIEMAGVE